MLYALLQCCMLNNTFFFEREREKNINVRNGLPAHFYFTLMAQVFVVSLTMWTLKVRHIDLFQVFTRGNAVEAETKSVCMAVPYTFNMAYLQYRVLCLNLHS